MSTTLNGTLLIERSNDKIAAQMNFRRYQN